MGLGRFTSALKHGSCPLGLRWSSIHMLKAAARAQSQRDLPGLSFPVPPDQRPAGTAFPHHPVKLGRRLLATSYSSHHVCQPLCSTQHACIKSPLCTRHVLGGETAAITAGKARVQGACSSDMGRGSLGCMRSNPRLTAGQRLWSLGHGWHEGRRCLPTPEIAQTRGLEGSPWRRSVSII